jgi:hypothetical protein
MRVYSVDPARYFPRNSNSDTLLSETTPVFAVPSDGGGTTSCPAFIEISLSTLPQLTGQQRIRVEIEPLVANKYWAVASVTHNDTQHVTVITPQ